MPLWHGVQLSTQTTKPNVKQYGFAGHRIYKQSEQLHLKSSNHSVNIVDTIPNNTAQYEKKCTYSL